MRKSSFLRWDGFSYWDQKKKKNPENEEEKTEHKKQKAPPSILFSGATLKLEQKAVNIFHAYGHIVLIQSTTIVASHGIESSNADQWK